MRVEQVRTNLVCNQRCGFCDARDGRHDPRRFHVRRLLAEIAALPEGLDELVLTGGEPTLRPDLSEIIAAAKGRRPRRTVLETNGMTLAKRGRAAVWAAAGLDAARVAMPAWGRRCDAITRVPGGFRHTEGGIDEALEAGLEVEIGLPLVAQELAEAARLPGLVSSRWPGVSGIRLRVVTAAPPPFVAPLRALAEAVEAIAAACREEGLAMRIDPRRALPPCLLPAADRLVELRVVPTGPRTEAEPLPACARCALSDRCQGLPRAPLRRFDTPEVWPVGDRRARRYLDGGGAARAQRSLRSDGLYAEPGGAPKVERVLRTVFACNQDCTFCFVDRELPAPGPERVRAEIRAAAEEGVGMLSLSGGEPTLDRALASHVRLAREVGLRVRLQTNAVALAAGELARELAAAGLDDAFVSLHGPDAATSDAITRAPGTFERTLGGIDALLAAAVPVRLNCVITGANYARLPGIVRLIAERFERRPLLVLSWAHASTTLVPVSAEITPAWSTVRPWLTEAVALARGLGVRWRGLDGQCGLPLCLPGRELLDVHGLPALPDPAPPEGFVKTAACASCALTLRCVGLRATHARLHGAADLRPLSPEDLPPAPAPPSPEVAS